MGANRTVSFVNAFLNQLSIRHAVFRKQEKPAPPPAPAPQPAPVSVPTPPPVAVQQAEPTPPVAEEPAPTSTGWEEPTTVQAPTWDDEPRPAPQAESVSASAVPEEVKPAQPEPTTAEEPIPERAAAAVPPGVVQPPASESPAALPPKPLTPSISTRPTPAPHRTNPKFKTTDQPVVLPASFGSGIEKVGMQFGSLSLGGEDFDAPTYVRFCVVFEHTYNLPTDKNPLQLSRRPHNLLPPNLHPLLSHSRRNLLHPLLHHRRRLLYPLLPFSSRPSLSRHNNLLSLSRHRNCPLYLSRRSNPLSRPPLRSLL